MIFIVHQAKEYMNLSGVALRKASNAYALSHPETDLLVLHDDLDTRFGHSRLKQGGSINGHNGLRSIVSVLGTRDFSRIRVGIGRPASQKTRIDEFVLSHFAADEAHAFERAMPQAEALVWHWLLSKKGISDTSTTSNKD